MKKASFLLSLLGIIGLTTAAQAQVRLGVKGGVSLSNFSNMSDADRGSFDAKYLVNGNAGVMLNAPLSSDGFFSLQPELLYSGKGNKLESSTGDDATLRLHYIDLPVLARINADGFIFELGPQVGYLVSLKDERNVGNLNTISTSLDGYNRFDVGYVAGVGYELESGLGFGVRYNGGISKVLKEAVGQVRSEKHNSVFQLQVGYLFGAK
jgi:hypothetical protein